MSTTPGRFFSYKRQVTTRDPKASYHSGTTVTKVPTADFGHPKRRSAGIESANRFVDVAVKLQVVLLSLSSSNLPLGLDCNSAYDVHALPSSEKAIISKIKVAARARVKHGHSY